MLKTDARDGAQRRARGRWENPDPGGRCERRASAGKRRGGCRGCSNPPSGRRDLGNRTHPRIFQNGRNPGFSRGAFRPQTRRQNRAESRGSPAGGCREGGRRRVQLPAAHRAGCGSPVPAGGAVPVAGGLQEPPLGPPPNPTVSSCELTPVTKPIHTPDEPPEGLRTKPPRC